MIKLFLKFILGGKTGKRESAIFTFLIWIGSVIIAVRLEFIGKSGVFLEEIIKFTAPFVFCWYAGAFGLEWFGKWTAQKEDNENDDNHTPPIG